MESFAESLIPERVTSLEADVRELKQDVPILKSDMADMKAKMERMSALMEEFNHKLTVALELLQHCVSMIPAVHKHDLQIVDTDTDLTVAQKIIARHINDSQVHVSPKRGRKKKPSIKGNEGLW